MKVKLCFIVILTTIQIVIAQPNTPTPAAAEQPKSRKEKAGDIFDAGVSAWEKLRGKKEPAKQTTQQTSPQQTVSKTPQQQANSSEQTQEPTTPAPTHKKSPDQPTDAKPADPQPPVVNTPVGEIDEMPDLSSKSIYGIKHALKQWQQIGQKVIVKMIIENIDANNPANGYIINGNANMLYDSNGNAYKGTTCQISSFISKSGDNVNVPFVFGAKSLATFEFNVGTAKITKVVGMNFTFFTGGYLDPHPIFFSIVQ